MPCSVTETSVLVSLRVHFGVMTSHGGVGPPKTTGTNVGGPSICLQPEVGRSGGIVSGGPPLRRSHLRPLRRGESWLVLSAPMAKQSSCSVQSLSFDGRWRSLRCPIVTVYFGPVWWECAGQILSITIKRGLADGVVPYGCIRNV